MRARVIKVALTVVAFLTMLAGCGSCGVTVSPSADTLSIINNAIDGITRNSADWMTILQDTRDKLTDSAQSTVRNEITNSLQRAEAAAGTEIKCIIDFIGSRVREDLLHIKEAILNEPVDPPIPALCSVVPSVIDLSLDPTRRNLITMNGYNFDTKPAIQAFLVPQNGASATDVTKYLFRTTHYEMTLNLGSNGIPVSGSSKEIDIDWQNQMLSAIPIIQSNPQCRVQTMTVSLGSHRFIPMNLVQGDRDFYGHGPHIDVLVSPGYVGSGGTITNATVLISVIFQEIGGDGTKVVGFDHLDNVVSIPSGWALKSISDLGDAHVIFDHDPSMSEERYPVGIGWVSDMLFGGFNGGTAAGGTAYVTVNFRPVTATLVQTQNCQGA
jgi:hypothetical protein